MRERESERVNAMPSVPAGATTTMSETLSLIRSEKDPSRLLSLFRSSAASLPLSAHHGRAALSAAVSSLSSSGDQSSVRTLLDSLTHPSSPNALPLHHAISLFGHAGMLSDARRLFLSAPPSVQNLNSLLFACLVSNNPTEAPKIYHQFTFSQAVRPDLATYHTLLKSLCATGSSRRFYSVLEQMVRQRIKPNATTFSIALAGLYREELFEDVRSVLWLMKKHGCHHVLSIYNVRIQSLCKLRRSNEAKELLIEMKKKGMKVNWVTYGHLILGFCCEGDLEQAKLLFVEMGKKGLVPESGCYFSLMYYLCKGRDFDAALEICRESLKRNWVPRFSIMKELVVGLVDESRVDEAREIVEMVKGRFPDNSEMWKEVEEMINNV